MANTKLQSLAPQAPKLSRTDTYVPVADVNYSTATITGATKTNPVVVTAANHGFGTGDRIYLHALGGMTQLNGRTFTVTFLSVNTFSLDGENGIGHSAYTSGGTAIRGRLSRVSVDQIFSLFDNSYLDQSSLGEFVDNRVDALLVEGANITLTYDDGANTLEIEGTAAGVTDHGGLTGLLDDDHPGYLLLAGRAGEQLLSGGGTAGTVAQVGMDRDFNGIDPKLRLRNRHNAAGAGSAIEFYKVNAAGTLEPAVRLVGERWASSANFGHFAIEIGSFGAWQRRLTLDINGLLTASAISGDPTIRAQKSAAPVGSIIALHSAGDHTSPALGTLAHGWWGGAHLNMYGRAGGTDILALDWQQRFGVGYAPAATPGMPAKFAVKNHADIMGVAVVGHSTQTANLMEWHTSGGTVLGTISENGYFTTRKTAAPADAELATGELAIWFDATAGSAKLMVKAKNASGTVVTGSVPLT